MNGIADHTSRKHVKHFFFKNIVYKNIKSIAQAQFFCIVKTFYRLSEEVFILTWNILVLRKTFLLQKLISASSRSHPERTHAQIL